MKVLDAGAGLGGPARFLAETYGCEVVGVDLTPAFVAVAEMLTERTGSQDKVTTRAPGAESAKVSASERTIAGNAKFSGTLWLFMSMTTLPAMAEASGSSSAASAAGTPRAPYTSTSPKRAARALPP